MARSEAALDVETGGGEVLAEVAEIGRAPALLVATESWPPNVAVARDRLRPLGAHVVAVADSPALPFVDGAFDLVVSRHPVVVLWDEIARVLRPGGTYFSQQIGPGTNRELTDFFMGPRPVNQRRSAASARTAANAAGLEVVDLRDCALRVEFFDVGAVVYFLRKVLWTVPGFTPEAYADRLRAMHERIRARREVHRHGPPPAGRSASSGLTTPTPTPTQPTPTPTRHDTDPRPPDGPPQLAWLTVLML